MSDFAPIAPVKVAHDKDMARAFLAGLDPNATKFTFQFLSDSGKRYSEIVHGTLDEIWPKVQALNTTERGVGVFVTINETDFKGRRRENIVRARALFVDADSAEQAERCAETFTRRDVVPSMAVKSGRGAHFYLFADDIPLEQFSVLQKNLIDKLGTDAAVKDLPRVMRLPGTLHLKNVTTPRLVKLYPAKNPSQRWKLSELVEKLGLLELVQHHGQNSNEAEFESSAFAGKKPAAAFAALNPNDDHVSDGLGYENNPLDPRPVIQGCLFLKDAFKTHGKNHTQPLWNLAILATTFFEKGDAFAHAIGDAHSGYTPAETDAMYARKLKERETKGLGWPSCKAIENEGCKLCKGCPHYGKIKSPLHLALVSAPTKGLIEDAKKDEVIPVSLLLGLLDKGADVKSLLKTMNQYFAVVRYGSQVLVASIIGNEVNCMQEADFHKMLANLEWYDPATVPSKLREMKERIERIGNNILSMAIDDYLAVFTDLIDFKVKPVKLSRRWFAWEHRRYFFGRGLVFEPGGPLEIPNDMINFWRGFGIEPKQGDWSLLRNHIFNVVCSRHHRDYNYLINWMALAVQQPNEPIGVAVAFRGAQGAGKGIVARTLGKLFGKHFAHIANGDQLTGRFNASLATSCLVFLDEALWAGDKKGEGVLKALITEPSLQLEAKFKDPIMVDNRLRIMVASNNDWMVPAGIGDRRWFVLDVANTYAGTKHREYWAALYAEIEHGGAAAMFHDLLNMNLSGFDVRAVPDTAAKAQQQAHSLHGTEAWLHHILQEGAIGQHNWLDSGLDVRTDEAYTAFLDFSKHQREYKPDGKSQWAKKIRARLGLCVANKRETIGERARLFEFGSLADCRYQFAKSVGAPDLEWEEPDKQPNPATSVVVIQQAAAGVDGPTEFDALLDVPGVDGRPLMPERFERTMAQAAADLALVQKKT
jgi:hypothetical protein